MLVLKLLSEMELTTCDSRLFHKLGPNYFLSERVFSNILSTIMLN